MITTAEDEGIFLTCSSCLDIFDKQHNDMNLCQQCYIKVLNKKLFKVEITKTNENIVKIKCPLCSKQHSHGIPYDGAFGGSRVPHCQKYELGIEYYLDQKEWESKQQLKNKGGC